MTNAELISKIKTEIERLIEESNFDESANLYSLLSFLDTLQEPEFPATDEEMEAFLASHPKVEVPEKYKTPDWLFKELEQEPEIDFEQELYNRFGMVKDFTLGMRIAQCFYNLGKNAK